jgi:hypothetical protein
MSTPHNPSPVPLLSILTPSLPERIDTHLRPLWTKLQAQIERDSLPGEVEHLVFLDNRRRNVGEKRTALLQMARGRYLAFLDDDDDCSDDYVAQIVAAIRSFIHHAHQPDVITFRQRAIIEGRAGICEWRLGHPNEPWRACVSRSENAGLVPGGQQAETGCRAAYESPDAPSFRRPPWHPCAWRASLAKAYEFPATNEGEDWAWTQLVNAAALDEHHIPAVLHVYRYDPAVSACSPGRSFLTNPITWREIPGWFDFPEVYDFAVARAADGASFVEVGVWMAQSTTYLFNAIRASRKRIALRAYDTFAGSVTEPEHQRIVAEHGGSILRAAQVNMARACGPDGPTVLARCDSVAAATLHADQSVDFCFIDADHTEAAVRRDIEAWLPKIKPGGILAGHDIDSPAVHAAVTSLLVPLYDVRQSGRSWLVILPNVDDIGQA